MGKTTIGVAIRISKSYRDTYRESRAACRTCILDATAVLLISSPPAICREQKLALSLTRERVSFHLIFKMHTFLEIVQLHEKKLVATLMN